MKGVIRGQGLRQQYYIDGKEVTQEQFEEQFPPRPIGDGAGLIGWKKPIHSEAAAVHPNQIPEAIENARQKGVPTDFDSSGRPIFRSREHRKQYNRAYGFHDRNGGYGD